MSLEPQPPIHAHVRLLAGHGEGRPVFEVLPAFLLASGVFELAGSPGPVLGCAAGDVLRVGDDGRFELVEPGPNLCVQAARSGDLTAEEFAELRRAIGGLGGVAEAPGDLRFAVVTVGRAVGVPAIARVMDRWAAGVDGVDWWFGNGDQADAAR